MRGTPKKIALVTLSFIVSCLLHSNWRCYAFFNGHNLPAVPLRQASTENSSCRRRHGTSDDRHRHCYSSKMKPVRHEEERESDALDRRRFAYKSAAAVATAALALTGGTSAIFTGADPASAVGEQPGLRTTAPPPPLLLVPALRAKVGRHQLSVWRCGIVWRCGMNSRKN